MKLVPENESKNRFAHPGSSGTRGKRRANITDMITTNSVVGTVEVIDYSSMKNKVDQVVG